MWSLSCIGSDTRFRPKKRTQIRLHNLAFTAGKSWRHRCTSGSYGRVGNGVERSTALPCENQIQFAVRPMVLDMLYEGPDLKMLFRFSGLFSQNLALTNSNTYRMRKAFDSILSLFFPRQENNLSIYWHLVGVQLLKNWCTFFQRCKWPQTKMHTTSITIFSHI